MQKFSLLLFFLFALSFTLSAQNTAKEMIREHQDYHSIVASGAVNVYLIQAKGWEVKVDATERLHQFIQTEVKNGVLHISTKDMKNVKKNEYHKVFVRIPQLKSLHAMGAADVFADDLVVVDQLNLKIQGAGDVHLKVEAQKIKAIIQGAADAYLSGTVEDIDLDISGAADFKAYKLKAQNCQVKARGSSDVYIEVASRISGQISGSSDLHYKGKPSSQKIQVSGSADVHH